MPAPEDTRASAQADLDIGALYVRLQHEVARTTGSEGASWAELRDLAERYRVLGARRFAAAHARVARRDRVPVEAGPAPAAALVRRADRLRTAHVQRRGAEADRLARGTARRTPVRIAYYSPMPPERSGIADYSALLVPALRTRFDVDVAERNSTADGDVALYHVGNDAGGARLDPRAAAQAAGRRRAARLRAAPPRCGPHARPARTRRHTSRRSSVTTASRRGCSGSA